MKACDPAALAWRVNLLLDEPERLATLRKNALRLGRPDAAEDVSGRAGKARITADREMPVSHVFRPNR